MGELNHINVDKNVIQINDSVIRFPASYKDIEEHLGEARVVRKDGSSKVIYIYDDLGIKFETTPLIYLKKRKAFIDAKHDIVYMDIYVESDFLHDDNLPQTKYNGRLTFYHQSAEVLFKFFDTNKAIDKENGESDFKAIVWDKKEENVNGEEDKLKKSVSISFDPVRAKTNENYELIEPTEEILEFDNLNFKLAIIQELMYNQELLKPYFDIFDYLKYKKSKSNTETSKPIKLALQFFKDIKIPKKMADNIVEIKMDGGNEIYSNIAPLWDGEDDLFSINQISDTELRQFNNLKCASIMTSNFDAVKIVFDKNDVEVKQI